MKWGCFYKGLNPKYRQMLAHKVDGENPAGYSDLLLAARKLERRAETMDPLPPKTTMTSVSNITHSQTSGNPFPSCKLKGNCIVTPWAVTIGSNEFEVDSSVEQEGDGEMEPSAGEEVKASGGMEGTDQPMEYIIHSAKVVKLYQQKNRGCFGCRSLDHLVWDCLKNISKTAWKLNLNAKEGLSPSEVSCQSANIPRWKPLSIMTSWKTPFLNQDQLTHWSESENIAWVRINDESCWALLDNGSTISAVMPEFVKAYSLDISQLSGLVDSRMGINGFGGLFYQNLGLHYCKV